MKLELRTAGDSPESDRSKPSSPDDRGRVAVGVSAVTVLLAAVLGILAYRASIQQATSFIAANNLSVARRLGNHILAHGWERATDPDRDQLISELQRLWSETDPLYVGSFVCLVESPGVLIMHSARPDLQGTDLSGVELTGNRRVTQRSVGELLASRQDWAGANRSISGEEQLVGYAYFPEFTGHIVVHIATGSRGARALGRGSPLDHRLGSRRGRVDATVGSASPSNLSSRADRRPAGGNGSSRSRAAASAVAEDGGDRTPGGRGGTRLQQPSHVDHGQRRARSTRCRDERDPGATGAEPRRDPAGGGARGPRSSASSWPSVESNRRSWSGWTSIGVFATSTACYVERSARTSSCARCCTHPLASSTEMRG